MKRAKILAIACVFVFCISLTGCGSNKTISEGTYVAESAIDPAYYPTLSILEDNAFQFNLGMGAFVKGTYKVDDDEVNLTVTDNNSNLTEDEVNDIKFSIGEEEKQLILDSDIDGFAESGTIFSAEW